MPTSHGSFSAPVWARRLGGGDLRARARSQPPRTTTSGAGRSGCSCSAVPRRCAIPRMRRRSPAVTSPASPRVRPALTSCATTPRTPFGLVFSTPSQRPVSTFYPDNETVQIQIADDEGFLFPLKDQIEDYWDASRAHMHSALRLSTRTAGSTARVGARTQRGSWSWHFLRTARSGSGNRANGAGAATCGNLDAGAEPAGSSARWSLVPAGDVCAGGPAVTCKCDRVPES